MANKKEPKEATDTAGEGLETTATQQTQEPAEQAAEAIDPEESQQEAIDTAGEGLEPTATPQTQEPAEQAAEAIDPEESQQEDNQSLGDTQPADPVLDLEQIGSDLLDEHQDRDEVYITSDGQAFFGRHHAVNHASNLHNKRVLTIGRTSTK